VDVGVGAGLVVGEEFDRLFEGVTAERCGDDALPDIRSRDIRLKGRNDGVVRFIGESQNDPLTSLCAPPGTLVQLPPPIPTPFCETHQRASKAASHHSSSGDSRDPNGRINVSSRAQSSRAKPEARCPYSPHTTHSEPQCAANRAERIWSDYRWET
jgi:hypothetical protein